MGTESVTISVYYRPAVGVRRKPRSKTLTIRGTSDANAVARLIESLFPNRVFPAGLLPTPDRG